MKAEIVSIGTELLLGEITDTNASYTAGELPALGIDLYWISQVGDNRERLIEVLERAWKRADLVITTGGLGPSEGDITRQCIAGMLGEELKTDPALVAQLETRFRRTGRQMPKSNLRQAVTIPSASILPNARGTAPGWWVEKDNHILVAMPGPPAEMYLMWQGEVLPRLRKRATQDVILSLTIKTWGLSESAINELFLPLFSSSNPTLAIYVKADGIHLRLTAKAPGEKPAEELIKPLENRVRSVLGEHVWGTGQDTLEDVVGKLLVEKKLTLAVMEGFSGGLLSHTISGSASASSCFRGSLVTSSTETLKAFGVSGSPERPETTGDMAEAVKFHFHADIGVSISDVVYPSKPDDRTSEIVYVAVVSGAKTKLVTIRSPRDRSEAKRWVVSSALFELIRMLTYPGYFSGKM